jgi:hypothetical protein
MGVFSTPRPVPARLAPFLAGAGVVVLALPVVLAGGFSVSGWVLAAVLWAAAEALGWWLSRIPTGADNLGTSGIVGVGYAVRGIGAMVVLLVVAAANKEVGVTAFVIYALAYTLSLGVSLLEYFGAKPVR